MESFLTDSFFKSFLGSFLVLLLKVMLPRRFFNDLEELEEVADEVLEERLMLARSSGGYGQDQGL